MDKCEINELKTMTRFGVIIFECVKMMRNSLALAHAHLICFRLFCFVFSRWKFHVATLTNSTFQLLNIYIKCSEWMPMSSS